MLLEYQHACVSVHFLCWKSNPSSCPHPSGCLFLPLEIAAPAGVDALKLGENATRSSSIGAVRWTLPEEDVQIHSSAPSRATNNLAKRSQVRLRALCLVARPGW